MTSAPKQIAVARRAMRLSLFRVLAIPSAKASMATTIQKDTLPLSPKPTSVSRPQQV